MDDTTCKLQLEIPKRRWLQTWRESGKFVILVVAVALFLDNMLFTIIVPIIPEYLYELNGVENKTEVNSTHEVVENKESRHIALMEESTEIGYMLGSKAIIQFLTNPIVGPLTNKLGFNIPMFAGFLIMFVSTMLFAFGISYEVLFLARALQGVGSSCASVAGMGLLATRYTDDHERGKVMTLALGGLAFGVIIGPPIGGIMYQFMGGKTLPFLIICVLILIGVCLQLMMIHPKLDEKKENVKPSSLKTLLMDPYILITAGGIFVANIGVSFLDASLPIWMIDKMSSDSWELGAVFVPCNILYWIGISFSNKLGLKIGRWLMSLLGLLFIGVSLLMIPACRSVIELTIPIGLLGFANAMVEIALLPELGHLVDIRHSSVYGNVYAIGDAALCLGFGIGPIIGNIIMKKVGFTYLMVGSASLCFLFAPVFYFLKNPPVSKKLASQSNNDQLSVEMVPLGPNKLTF